METGVICWRGWIGRPEAPRLTAVREQLAAVQEGIKPPVYRYRVPDGRERMHGKAVLTRWERYQQAAQSRLRDERRRA